MSRADLLALTPEALAALANLGLVKRAQRELSEGKVPELSEEPDGTVVGKFADGALTRLTAGSTLKDTLCSCGAPKACRHRVAVALAYKPWLESMDPSASAAPVANVDWSPGDIEDAQLERALGDKLFKLAQATRARGLVATIEHASPKTAKLPSCTVRFLVPRDVAYARCDCALSGGACEHLALAVWAFRAAPSSEDTSVVSLGSERRKAIDLDPLEDALDIACDLLRTGIANSRVNAAQFAALRAQLESAGAVWLHGILVDLEIALEGYHKQSALWGTREIAALLVELAGRARAARAAKAELPARFVMGENEAQQTRLDHVRLIPLGARVRADERSRFAEVFLADPDSSMVLVMDKRWDYDEKSEPEDGPALARRNLLGKASVRRARSRAGRHEGRHTAPQSLGELGQLAHRPNFTRGAPRRFCRACPSRC
ncbi:MAG: hypothetical protein QM756_38900 [Polyangiaceae bacterium]